MQPVILDSGPPGTSWRLPGAIPYFPDEKLAKPSRCWASLRELTGSIFLRVSTFSLVISTPSPETIYLRNSICCGAHSHLSGAMHNLLSHMCLSTSRVMSSSPNRVSDHMMRSSMKADIPWSSMSRNMLLFMPWNVAGAMTTLKGMTVYANSP